MTTTCFSWSCAGPRAGDGCVVCHSPAWVKDIQINRQLSSIIQLFCGLESLFNPTKQPDPPVAETHPGTAVLKSKKIFKIWFSPRSRKVRCRPEKSEVTTPDGSSLVETAAAQQSSPTAQCQDLSVFNFTSSSQDSSSSQSCEGVNKKRSKTRSTKNNCNRRVQVQRPTTTTRKQAKENSKKERLEAINQQWGITKGAHVSSKPEQPCADVARRSSKRVSFQSPAVTSDESQLEVPQVNTNELNPASNSMGGSISGGRINVLNYQTQPGQSMSSSVIQQDQLPANNSSPNNNPEKLVKIFLSEKPSKRARVQEKDSPLEDTPKRPRASPGKRRKSLAQMSPVVLNPPSLDSPKSVRSSKNSRGEEKGGVFVASPVSTENHNKSPCSPGSSVGRPSPGSPAFMKRNHKGETSLHLAAIKGDVEAVRELLDQGVDPNLKDNAGWTPLHEACNLGHLAVVEVLVSRGALLNTPGYENDSPLHDAVRNGHPAIVKRLLQLGASQNVLNLHGKRPADYAVSLEMLEIFQEAAEATQYANSHTSPGPSANLSAVSECLRRDQTAVFLASKLSAAERHQLARLGVLLGGRVADTFSGSVSHVVVPEGQIPTTNSTLLGLLAGCWVVKYSWVEACLQAGKWLPEAEHEAGEGPRRSRINRCSLLPPLFDGCFFFLLGSFKSPTKDELSRLLRGGGGQLLSRQPKPDSDVTQTLNAAAYHAQPGSEQALSTQYIIYDPQGPYKPAVVRRGKVWSAPSTWLIDCIVAFCLLPVADPQTVK
ncbi:BRCA1-associated RING domain protein 1 isoform X2 [Melanotaenia boesemani]|uniref:BRCA1-associated RING domain protein 1 isoform X2 n=1 Tax=Melanotaenia boesemani TaxID=1250792 RepID=UPI001C0471A9|nr:BRCA1-associated RING domain protein 1 isoform X2 [Melanotaenia boesemani]